MANLISAGDGSISGELLGSWPALNQASIELQSFEKSLLSHFFVTLVEKYVYLNFDKLSGDFKESHHFLNNIKVFQGQQTCNSWAAERSSYYLMDSNRMHQGTWLDIRKT